MNEPRSTQNHMNAAPKDESAGAQAVAAAHSLPPPDASEADVLAAWLAAGARSDVAAMRGLRIQFPQWLDLQRPVGPATSDVSPRFCSWSNFHLRTLGASAIHTAAWHRDLAVARFLLEAGQGPDTGDDGGMTPAMVAILRLNLLTMRCVFHDGEAVRRNLVEDCREDTDEQRAQVTAVLDLLLHFGADVNASSQDGKTALHCSTSDDAYEVAEFLLDAGASVDAQDESGKTALHYCVQEGGLLVTDLLLSRGANIDLADADGNSPLTLALQRASLNVLQLFLNHHQLVATPQRHDFGADALLRAVEMRSEAIVRFIVENEYAHVTACNAKGETPMHRAILQHDPGMMEMLSDLDLEGGSLTATTAEKLETPAHYAARYGSHREVHTLLQCLTRAFGDLGELPELGAENPLDAVDANGKTSLFIAGTLPLSSGSGGIGRWALEVEAVAVAVGSLADRDEKVQLLLDHGARLFPAGVLATGLASSASIPDSPSQMVLPTHVQSCLRTWLAEDAVARVREPEGEEAVLQVDPLEALTELCVAWIACVPRLGPSVTLLSIVTCAGYGHDVLPLLLDLPLRRRGFPALLHQLRKFARREPEHALLLQLQHELSAAWRELEELASATSVLQLA